ncbi:MAG: hypothetical protein HC910_12120 [Spirulinaceae cyanobacterium SM2_1_0]|nr:hypothetical protein [Spirulinaceae cyanobacterium SM2_1_0]
MKTILLSIANSGKLLIMNDAITMFVPQSILAATSLSAMFIASLVLSQLPARAEVVYELEPLAVQLFDRTTGEIVPFEPPYPNAYGLNMDLLIRVPVRQVQGDIQVWPPPELTLAITAPGYDYPATGPVPPLEEEHRQPLELYSSDHTYHFLFVVPYRCYFDTLLTASVPGAQQTRTVDLGCAE